jgi:hypothetical protein
MGSMKTKHRSALILGVEPVARFIGISKLTEVKTEKLRMKHTYITQRIQGRSASTVDDSIGHGLNDVVMAFSWVLMLLVRFTFPIVDAVGTKDVDNLRLIST